MILHLKPCLMWCMLFVGNINLTNMTELGDLTLIKYMGLSVHQISPKPLQVDS